MTEEKVGEDLLLNPSEASKTLRVKVSTLASWRVKKYGPTWVKIGRLVYYKKSDLERFISQNSHN